LGRGSFKQKEKEDIFLTEILASENLWKAGFPYPVLLCGFPFSM